VYELIRETSYDIHCLMHAGGHGLGGSREHWRRGGFFTVLFGILWSCELRLWLWCWTVIIVAIVLLLLVV